MKRRFPAATAIAVSEELCAALAPVCERWAVAGSLRRGKAEVGDIEILFIPRFEKRRSGLFDSERVNLADERIESLRTGGTLLQRLSIRGTPSWGAKNKLAIHVASGIPVDLFTATAENWFNYLVCRTGPAELNTRICCAAIARGWKWNPYGEGFSRGGPLSGEREIHAVASEQDVFEFAGLPFLPPERR